MRRKKDQMTTKELEEEQAKDPERMRKKRAQMATEEIEERLEKNKRKYAQLTTEEL
jgi:hypothetical protein